jgi:hypothetical protein
LVKRTSTEMKSRLGALEHSSRAGRVTCVLIVHCGPRPGVSATPCRAISRSHLTPCPGPRPYRLRKSCHPRAGTLCAAALSQRASVARASRATQADALHCLGVGGQASTAFKRWSSSSHRVPRHPRLCREAATAWRHSSHPLATFRAPPRRPINS